MNGTTCEEGIFGDDRLAELIEIVGDEEKALGKLWRFWRFVGNAWRKGRGLMPEHRFHRLGFGPILEVGLAEVRDGGVYAKGAEDIFGRIIQKQMAGVTSGEARRQKRTRPEQSSDRPGTTCEGRVMPQDQPLGQESIVERCGAVAVFEHNADSVRTETDKTEILFEHPQNEVSDHTRPRVLGVRELNNNFLSENPKPQSENARARATVSNESLGVIAANQIMAVARTTGPRSDGEELARHKLGMCWEVVDLYGGWPAVLQRLWVLDASGEPKLRPEGAGQGAMRAQLTKLATALLDVRGTKPPSEPYRRQWPGREKPGSLEAAAIQIAINGAPGEKSEPELQKEAG